MSIGTPDTEAISVPSVKSRLAAARAAAKKERTFKLDVPGYEGLQAEYHPLDYGTLRRIGARQKNEPDEYQAEVNVAADTLANACDALWLDGEELEYRWSTVAAHELFGIGEDELPEGTGARQAILAIFPRDLDVMTHLSEYSEEASAAGRQIDEDVSGESVETSPVQ